MNFVFFMFIIDTESSSRSRIGKNRQSQTANGKDLDKLRSREKTLHEENNLLRIKNDLLLDMISEVYSEMKLEAETKRD